MKKRARYIRFLTIFGTFLCAGSVAADQPRANLPDGAALLRVLGPNAKKALAVAPTGPMGALVAVPSGQTAASLGLKEVAPGIAEVRGEPSDLLAFASAHPDARMEVSPPLHLLLDQVGKWTRAKYARTKYGLDGSNALVGIADTGIDFTHPDFLDETGHTRILWLLDLSLPPLGKHADLEAKFGVKDGNGTVVSGAVLDSDDINALLATAKTGSPVDEVGHGTHVASIAAGGGGGTPYIGIAPKAGLVVARVTRQGTESTDNDDLVDGTAFLFDRADAVGKPIAVNLSI
ncbi:MAG TPA: S8 family serine peptidase, partial [Polyangiaceae bacterium]